MIKLILLFRKPKCFLRQSPLLISPIYQWLYCCLWAMLSKPPIEVQIFYIKQFWKPRLQNNVWCLQTHQLPGSYGFNYGLLFKVTSGGPYCSLLRESIGSWTPVSHMLQGKLRHCFHFLQKNIHTHTATHAFTLNPLICHLNMQKFTNALARTLYNFSSVVSQFFLILYNQSKSMSKYTNHLIE